MSRTVTRRHFPQTTGLAATALVAAPHVRRANAGGTLTLAIWDH